MGFFVVIACLKIINGSGSAIVVKLGRGQVNAFFVVGQPYICERLDLSITLK